MTWGDYFFGTLQWIDNDAGTRSKHGIIVIPTLNRGDAWYYNSTLWCDNRSAEIHVYDPADIASSLAGDVPVWKVRPKTAWDITADLPGFGAGSPGGTAEPGAIVGTAFDPLLNRLYALQQCQVSEGLGFVSLMHVWSVGGG